MFTEEDFRENFNRFILEINKQTNITLESLKNPLNFNEYLDKIKHSDNYVENLRLIIKRKSYSKIFTLESNKKQTIDIMMALNTIIDNLEKIGDNLLNIVNQLQYFEDKYFLDKYEYNIYFDKIILGVNLIHNAFLQSKLKDSVKICSYKFIIDKYYKRDFAIFKENLNIGQNNQDLITFLFILRYIKRIGDNLLNIGEAIISAIIGDKLRIHQYMIIQDSINTSENNIIYEKIGINTKSGCSIGKIKEKSKRSIKNEIVFKEGNKFKLAKEKEKLDIWRNIDPELTPKVLNFEEIDDKASLIIEYLIGYTIQHIIVDLNTNITKIALNRILEKVEHLWYKTKKNEISNANTIHQMKQRLEDVYKLHTYFKESTINIGKILYPSFQDITNEVEKIDNDLYCPFSIMIHGDFNNDNIIYNLDKDAIYYIDLNRSQYTDYIQDVAVFMVSNFRIPVFKRNIRHKINLVIKKFYKFAKNFAQENNDNTFDIRLAIAVGRALVTSTRFELKKDFATTMYLRAKFLFEKVIEYNLNGKKNTNFEFPLNIIIY